MSELDGRLSSLRHLPVPVPPPLEALQARNQQRSRRRVMRMAVGAVLVVLAAAGGVLWAGSTGDTPVFVGEPDRPSDGVVLAATVYDRYLTPPEVTALDGLEPCEEPPDRFVELLDPDGTHGLAADIQIDTVAPSHVLDRVPVDVRAARDAGCVSAMEGAEAGFAALRVEDAAGHVRYEAAALGGFAHNMPAHFPSVFPDAPYQQTQLGSGHNFVGYAAHSGGSSMRLVGLTDGLAIALSAPPAPRGDETLGIGLLIATPPRLDRETSERINLTPQLLPEAAGLCVESPFTLPYLLRWCHPDVNVEVQSGPLEPIDGDQVTINGRPAVRQRTHDTWRYQIEADIEVAISGAVEADDANQIVASIPAIAARLDNPRTGSGDLRSDLSEGWVRDLIDLAGGSIDDAAFHRPPPDEAVFFNVTTPDGLTYRVIAAPDWPVQLPYAAIVTPIGEIDLLLSHPRTPQAIAGFSCGRISWQLIADDQQPRDHIEHTARLIITELHC